MLRSEVQADQEEVFNMNNKIIVFLLALIFSLGILNMFYVSAFDWANNSVAYWNFNDSINFSRSQTGIKNWTQTGNLTLNTTCVLNNCATLPANLNATDNYLNQGELISSTSGNATLTFWFKLEPTINNIELMGRGTTTTTTKWLLYLSGTNFSASFNDNPKVSNYTITPSVFHFVVMRWNATGTNVYVDNRNILDFGTSLPSTGGTGGDFIFRSYNTSKQFKNLTLDEMGFFNKTFNTTDISELWNGGFGLGYNNEVVAPVVLLLPNNATGTLLNQLNFSARLTSQDVSYNLTNATLSLWRPDGTLFSTTNISLSGTTNISNFSVSGINTLGLWKWNVLGCNTNQNCYSSTSNNTFFFGVVENSQTYTAQVYSSQTENVSLNISYNSSLYSSIIGTLYYNGTAYSSTQTGTGTGNSIFITSPTAPSVSSNSNITFFWQLALYNGTTTEYFNSSIKSQSVLVPQPFTSSENSCSGGLATAQFFTFAEEQNRTTLSNVTINYNFQYGYSGNLTAVQTFSNITANNFSICINSSIPFYSIGLGEIQYVKANYVSRRFYLFENTRLTNVTVNNTLFSLNTPSATEFSFVVTDNFAKIQQGVIVSLLRWYPEINSYLSVEMSKTDNNGNAVFNVETGSVDYRIAVYQTNGNLLAFLSPVRFVCQVAPCVYSVIVPQQSLTLYNIQNLQQSLTFNRTSKIFTYIWNDPTQVTQTLNLSVYRTNYNDTSLLCSSSSTGFTGLLICDVSAFTGEVRAIVTRSASPSVVINSLIESLSSAFSDLAQGKTMGLLLSMLLFAFGFLAGLFNPVVALVLGAVALVPAYYVGVFGTTFFVGVIILEVIIIHFLRRT